MNVAEIIERARDVAGEVRQVANAPLAWEDAVVLRHLNAAYLDIWNRLRGADEQWGLDWRTAAELGAVATQIDATTGQLVLPVELGDVALVEDLSDGDARTMHSLPLARLRNVARDDALRLGANRAWSFGGSNNVMLFTRPAGLDTAMVRVWFVRHVPRLARFSVTNHPTTSSLRISITADPALGQKPSPDTDAYRGAFFQCTAAPSNGSPQRLKFQASGWAIATHPNYDLTLRTPHGLTSGTSEWEVLPLLPEPHHEAIAQLGAVRMYQSIGDVAAAREIAKQAGRDVDQLVQMVESRQIQTPRYVVVEA